ncbi:hypothetical protein BOW28_08290 [Solemya velum gill symbiont]|uniref:phytanoyl-CoA dioxygenase family protein n=1 Tax=Solemya velum gill symbiont TaxID=2340 RepID=UPI0009960A30|nr:phytanoyl-CoA dioxygenase family protein [Solemya velum gill symbiont]OOZ16983.1 hypothetical protein BOW28_08290 [Solemya velum gill symbiont]OOZ26421.1 hypothetical protein BOW32_08555 [Solemya velum gill symbiont]
MNVNTKGTGSNANNRPDKQVNVRESYLNDDYLVIRQALDQTCVDILAGECDRLSADEENFDQLIAARKNLDGRLVRDRLDPLSRISEVFKELSNNNAITSIVSNLFDGDCHLFKDKLIYKPPGTTGYLLHQDYTRYSFTGIPASDILSVMIPTDPATEQSGAITIFSGYTDKILPAPPGDPYAADPSAVNLDEGIMIELEPGDLLLFHSAAPHLSGPNLTHHPKRAAFITYNHGKYGQQYNHYYAGRESTYSNE